MKCIRCNEPQEGVNHLMNQPVCKEHSNWSEENIQAIQKIMNETNETILDDNQNQPEKTKVGNPNIKDYAHIGGQNREGTKNKKTLAKEKAWEEYEQKMVDSLFAITRAQLLMALGAQYLFKIEKYYEGKKLVSKEPKRVTDPDEMESYLNMYINGEYDNSPNATYFFFTASDPNVSAIRDILDRLKGKPTQSIDHTTKGMPIIEISGTVINKYETPRESGPDSQIN